MRANRADLRAPSGVGDLVRRRTMASDLSTEACRFWLSARALPTAGLRLASSGLHRFGRLKGKRKCVYASHASVQAVMRVLSVTMQITRRQSIQRLCTITPVNPPTVFVKEKTCVNESFWSAMHGVASEQTGYASLPARNNICVPGVATLHKRGKHCFRRETTLA
jgi:hypothetical protein